MGKGECNFIGLFYFVWGRGDVILLVYFTLCGEGGFILCGEGGILLVYFTLCGEGGM